MDQQLLDKLLAFVVSVYDMEPLDDEGGETELATEALDLIAKLEELRMQARVTGKRV